MILRHVWRGLKPWARPLSYILDAQCGSYCWIFSLKRLEKRNIFFRRDLRSPTFLLEGFLSHLSPLSYVILRAMLRLRKQLKYGKWSTSCKRNLHKLYLSDFFFLAFSFRLHPIRLFFQFERRLSHFFLLDFKFQHILFHFLFMSF